MPPSRSRKTVRVHSLRTGGIGSTKARVQYGKVTDYMSKRDPLRPLHGVGGREGGGGEGGAAAAGGAGEDFGHEDDNLQYPDRDGDGEPEFIIHRRTRSSTNARERRAANWQRTETMLAEMMLKDELPHPCPCTRGDIVTVRFIDLNAYEDREINYCNCARSCSSLLKEGYFPCAPIKPRTAFSTRLLQLLHEQSVLGYVSRSAWSGGLRAVFESEKKAVLPAFDRELRDTYQHWLAVKSQVDTLVADSLERRAGGIWQPEALSNICPACFDILPGDSDNAIAISTDGNQQHVRFQDKSSYEYEKSLWKLFVDYGRRNFGLAGSMSAARMAGCGNKFKATSGWNKAEAMAQSKKALDETGLMAATCFHGTILRFMNVYGGNERYSHVIRLLESIVAECPAAGPIRLCYDVACEFEPSLRRHDAPWVDRVQVRIGRFHLYGHEMRCHILYNLLRTDGFGLMVGEEVEQLWYMLGNLVKTGRVSSGPRRSQIIDASGQHLARRGRERIGYNISRRWKKMVAILQENHAVLQRVMRMTVPQRTDKSGHVHPRQPVTLAYLDEQGADQIAYYRDYRRTRAQADEVSEVQRLQLEIVKLVTERRVEVDVLHHRVRGGKMARKFVNRLNSRWKPLERLLTKYNLEVAKPVFEGRLSPLSLRALKEDGIGDNDGEIWDLERLMSSSDWAVHKFVREGIEALHRIKRAEEEQAALLLHIHRVSRWALRQAEVLLRILGERAADADEVCTRKWLESLLFSRFRTIQSMLDSANSFSLDIEEHRELLDVEGRIRAMLVTVPVDGVEDEGEDEGEGEDDGQGEDEGEDEDEDEDDIAEEEMGEAVMRALVEELRNEADEAVEVELQWNGRVE